VGPRADLGVLEKRISPSPKGIRTPNRPARGVVTRPSVIQNPGWSEQLWANYSSVFPLKLLERIIIIISIIRYGIFALNSFTSALRDKGYSYTTEFTVGGTNFRVIRTTPPSIQ